MKENISSNGDPFVVHANGNNGIMNSKNERIRSNWKVNASVVAKNTFNPIRDVMETMTLTDAINLIHYLSKRV